MNRRIALATLALLTAVSFAYGDDPNYKDLVGTWELDFPKNDFHYVEITAAKGTEAGPYVWSNKAGRRWPCSAGHIQAPNNGPTTYIIAFGEKTPYPGHVLHLIRDSEGKLVFLKEHVKSSDTKELQTWVMRRNTR